MDILDWLHRLLSESKLGVFHFVEPVRFFMFQSSDQDLVFLGQTSKGIENDLLKKKRIMYVKKNTEKSQHL